MIRMIKRKKKNKRSRIKTSNCAVATPASPMSVNVVTLRQLYTVSQKKISNVFSCNSIKRYLIFTTFGKSITERLGNQKLFYFLTSPQ